MMPKKVESEFVDLSTACKILHISKSTMYHKTHRKTTEIPFYKIGRKILFKVSELHGYIENHRVRTKSELETEIANRLISQN